MKRLLCLLRAAVMSRVALMDENLSLRSNKAHLQAQNEALVRENRKFLDCVTAVAMRPVQAAHKHDEMGRSSS